MPVNKVKSQKSKVKSSKKQSEKKTTTSRGLVSAPMYDAKGAKKGSFSLPKEIFGAKVNEPLIAQAVRVYLTNQRQGNANTKGRSDINLTKAKWYRQKGTGRARHHAKSAPIFVGGGVAHGPKAKKYSLTLPKKMKKNALFSALSMKAGAGEIKVLTGLSKIEGKTKNLDSALRKITDDKKGKSKIVLITSAKTKELENVYRAGRNIKNLKMVNVNLLNTYEVLNNKNLLLMKESIEIFGNLGGSAKQNIK